MPDPMLPIPLAPVFEGREPEERLRRVWRGIRARREHRTRAGQPWLRVMVTCVSALVLLAALATNWRALPFSARRAPAPIPTSIEPEQSARELDLGDGALVTVGPGSKLDVLEQTSRSVVLALRQGLSQFDIHPGGRRRFRIESAGISVEVVGTRFSVERSKQSLRVEVQRGRVLVRGKGVPDAVQALDAGRVLVVDFSSDERRSENHVAPRALSSSEAPSLVASNPAAPRTENAESLDWRVAATARQWDRAWASLGREGVARESAQTDDVAELISLADVARLSGHQGEALGPLRQVVQNHPGDPRSAMAAFTLGRMLLEMGADPAEAALAFERAISLKLPAALSEDAYARLVEAHFEAGAAEHARAAAEAYRARFPTGRRQADVARWSPR